MQTKVGFSWGAAKDLIKLINRDTSLKEYLKEDFSLDKYKISLSNLYNFDKNKGTHEESHGTIYLKEGIEPEYYYKPEENLAWTTANKESLIAWLEKNGYETDKYLKLIEKVTEAPGSESLSCSDKIQLDVLKGKIVNKKSYDQKVALYC